MKKTLPILVLVVLHASCVAPSVIVKDNVYIERLGIYFEPGEHVFSVVTNQFNTALDNFIASYNATSDQPFELFRAQANDSSTLRIKLLTTRLVSPEVQTAGVLVSMVGLSLPFIMASAGAPIVVFFYYFPNVKSMTELSLSEDINGATASRKEFVLASPGFLRSPEKQIKKHAVSFDKFLSTLVRQVAKQTARKKTNAVAKY